jgi:hypothetical protein
MGGAGHHDCVRLGHRLDAGCDVRGIAKRIHRLSCPGANYHRPRIDLDPNRELGVCRLLVDLRDRVENRQSGARGSLSVVVMRDRIAENAMMPSPT